MAVTESIVALHRRTRKAFDKLLEQDVPDTTLLRDLYQEATRRIMRGLTRRGTAWNSAGLVDSLLYAGAKMAFRRFRDEPEFFAELDAAMWEASDKDKALVFPGVKSEIAVESPLNPRGVEVGDRRAWEI